MADRLNATQASNGGTVPTGSISASLAGNGGSRFDGSNITATGAATPTLSSFTSAATEVGTQSRA